MRQAQAVRGVRVRARVTVRRALQIQPGRSQHEIHRATGRCAQYAYGSMRPRAALGRRILRALRVGMPLGPYDGGGEKGRVQSDDACPC